MVLSNCKVTRNKGFQNISKRSSECMKHFLLPHLHSVMYYKSIKNTALDRKEKPSKDLYKCHN